MVLEKLMPDCFEDINVKILPDEEFKVFLLQEHERSNTNK